MKAVENGTGSVCVFWEVGLDEGRGGWSPEGCRLLRDDEFVGTCECDHLTTFALLVVGEVCLSEDSVPRDVVGVLYIQDTVPGEPQESEDRGIGPFVYAGCLVSAVFLLLTILTRLFTRSGHTHSFHVCVSVIQKPVCRWGTATGVFLLNFAALLLLLDLIFVAAYHSSGFSVATCHGVSVVLHYLFLASALSLAGLVLAQTRGMERREAERTLASKCTVISGVLATWRKSKLTLVCGTKSI